MADSIVRLRVESSEYDAKIKRAAQGLQHMEEACRKVGGTLAILEKDEKDFVSSLGRMDTVSKDARGRINELTKAFTDLSVQYNRLSDEEKNGDYGKALQASLGDLKVRINDAKDELKGINGEIGDSGNLIGQLSDKFGVNVKQLIGWGAAIGAGKMALTVLKDSFFQTEGNIDEWGRTVEGAKGAYDVFLQSINNGSWSSFFDNLSTAVRGARDLYDALDRLGSIKANNQAAIAIVQQQIQQLRLAKQRGEDVDKQLKEATARLAQLQKQSVDAGKNAGEKQVQNTLRNSVNTTLGSRSVVSDAEIKKASDKIIKEGQKAFDEYARSFSELRKRATRADREESYTSSTGQTYTRTIKGGLDLSLLTKEQQKQYAIAKAVTERETELQEGISNYAQAVQEGTSSAREEFKGNRYTLQGIRGGSGTGTSTEIYVPLEGSIDYYKKLASEASKMITSATTDMARDEAQALYDEYMAKVKQLQGDIEARSSVKGMSLTDMAADNPADNPALSGKIELPTINLPTNELAELMEQLKALEYLQGINIISEDQLAKIDELREKVKGLQSAIPLTPAEKADKLAKENSQNWQSAASAIRAVGGAISQIEDPAAKVAATVAQAIATIALTFSQSLKGTVTPWDWIAAAAAGTATMVNTIAAIKSATEYHAEGGMVGMKGLAKGTDIVPAMLTPGEVVLNAAQSSNVADKLTSNNNGGFTSQPYLQGEMIFVGVNNALGRMGKGEIVTTSMLKNWKR